MKVKCLAQEHNTMSRPGLEPGPLDPESSTLTTTLPHLTHLPRVLLSKLYLILKNTRKLPEKYKPQASGSLALNFQVSKLHVLRIMYVHC